MPMIRLILVNEEFIIFIYMGRVGPRRLPCSSAILKNYNSREGQKVLGQRVSTTRFRSEPASRDWNQQKRRSRAVRGACHGPGKFKRMHCTVIYTPFIHTYAESQDESSSSKKSKIDRKRKRDRRLQKTRVNVGIANAGESFQKRPWSCLLSSRQVSQCYGLNYKLIFHCLVVNFII